MHTLILLFSALILPLMSVLPAPGPTPPLSLNIVEAEPGRVVVSPIDGNGTPLSNLTVDQFSVREDDGVDLKVDELEGFIDPTARVSLVLAIDVSGSMAGKPLQAATTAAQNLVGALGPQDRVAVLAFASNVALAGVFFSPDNPGEQNYTLDKQQLADFLTQLRAGGNTALYDAAYRAVQVATLGANTRRAVILLTDGRDERAGGGAGSTIANSDSAIFEATRHHVPVFTVAVGRKPDKSYLKRLALLTGGAYQETSDADQLTQLFQNVLNRLKLRYTLSYASRLPADNQPHRIRVSLRVGEETVFAETNAISATGSISSEPGLEYYPGWDPLPVTPQAEAAPASQSGAEVITPTETVAAPAASLLTPTETLTVTPQAGASEIITPAETATPAPEPAAGQAVTPAEALTATPPTDTSTVVTPPETVAPAETVTPTDILTATPQTDVSAAGTPAGTVTASETLTVTSQEEASAVAAPVETPAPTPEPVAAEVVTPAIDVTATPIPDAITATGTLTGIVIGNAAETPTPAAESQATPAAVAEAVQQPAASEPQSAPAESAPAPQAAAANDSGVLPAVLLVGAAVVAAGALIVSRRQAPPSSPPPAAPDDSQPPPSNPA